MDVQAGGGWNEQSAIGTALRNALGKDRLRPCTSPNPNHRIWTILGITSIHLTSMRLVLNG